jgi:hypothetical protein
MSLNNIKRKENQLKKNLGEIVIKKYRLNKAEENLKSLTQLNSNAKEVFRKTKKQNPVTKTFTFFQSPSTEEFQLVNSNNSTNNLTTNTHETNNENEEVNLVEENEQLYKYTRENEELLEKMYENMNKIRNQNLYLNVVLKNKNKQEDLKALQNYVKTQRVILKKINDNIEEVNKIKKKYRFTGKLFMQKENKEKLNKSFTKKNKEGIELYVNNAVKKIKKIVNNNKRDKFHNIVESSVIKKTGKTSDGRIAELKIERRDVIKNIKPMGRLLKY